MLIDNGRLETGDGERFNQQDANFKLRIGTQPNNNSTQLDDVEIALEKSLLKGGFTGVSTIVHSHNCIVLELWTFWIRLNL